MIKYAYYPGCSGEFTAPEVSLATKAVCDKLGIELLPMESASCCGAGVLAEKSRDLAMALNARIFAIAEKMGVDIMTTCSTCLKEMNVLKQEMTEDPETFARINKILESVALNFEGKVKIKHLLWVLIDDFGIENLEKSIKSPLENFNIAPFYGCHILRPQAALNYEDSEHPTSLEKLITALGGNVVEEYKCRKKCCGLHIAIPDEGDMLGLVANAAGEARKKNADFIVTPCSLCQMSLDLYQDRAERTAESPLQVPVFHLPQMVGLAIGLNPHKLGFERHFVDSSRVIRLFE